MRDFQFKKIKNYYFLIRILCIVLSFPNISIISATPGPSFNPLNEFRSDFIKFPNDKLFLFENFFSNVCKSIFVKLPFFKSIISDSIISGVKFGSFGFCILGNIHTNDNLPSTN